MLLSRGIFYYQDTGVDLIVNIHFGPVPINRSGKQILALPNISTKQAPEVLSKGIQ